MPSASKIKGSGFEREIAKYLSTLYGESFIRAPGSGAYTGGSNSYRRKSLHENQVRSFKGDIVPGENFPLLNCEAKFYSDFGFHQLFTVCKQLEDWIEQLMIAADSDDLNILFIKINRRGRFVAVQDTIVWKQDCNTLRYKTKKWGGWILFSLESFFELNIDNVRTLSKK